MYLNLLITSANKRLDYLLMKIADTLFIQFIGYDLTEDRVLAKQVVIVQDDIDLIALL